MAMIKRLTKNDVSWIEPNSTSHQSGINLPMKTFSAMFEPFFSFSNYIERFSFNVNWFRMDGSLAHNGPIDVVYYPSKNELRMVKIPVHSVISFLRQNLLLVITRKEVEISITPIPPGGEHLLEQLGLNYLIEMLP